MNRVSREAFSACMPHAGAMILLDEVLDWDAQSLRAITASHRSAGNPLRDGKGLHIACGIEYAAQAMAIHAGLSGNAEGHAAEAPRAGLLVGLRDVHLLAPRLDEDPAPLTVDVQRRAGDAQVAVYAFSVRSPQRELLRGSATVILDAGIPGAPGTASAAGAAGAG